MLGAEVDRMKASVPVNGQPLPIHHLPLPLRAGALPRPFPEGFPVLLGALATFLPPLLLAGLAICITSFLVGFRRLTGTLCFPIEERLASRHK